MAAAVKLYIQGNSRLLIAISEVHIARKATDHFQGEEGITLDGKTIVVRTLESCYSSTED